MAHSSLRFGLGRFTTEAEVDFVVSHIIRTVNRLREMRYVTRSYSSVLCFKEVAVRCGKWSRRASISIPLTGRSTSIIDSFDILVTQQSDGAFIYNSSCNLQSD